MSTDNRKKLLFKTLFGNIEVQDQGTCVELRSEMWIGEQGDHEKVELVIILYLAVVKVDVLFSLVNLNVFVNYRAYGWI